MKLNKTRIIIFSIISLFALSGLIASIILTVEKIHLLQNSGYTPSCSINSVFNCASVIKSKEASVFGIPNTLLGISGYSLVLCFGVLALFGSQIHKRFYLLANLGSFIAFIFSYYLIYISAVKMQTLCPYCLVSAFSSTNIFFAITFYNLKENYFGFNKNFEAKINKFISSNWYIPIIVLWYTVVVGLVYYNINKI